MFQRLSIYRLPAALLLALAMLLTLAPPGLAQGPLPQGADIYTPEPEESGPPELDPTAASQATAEPEVSLPEGYTPPPALAGLSAADLAALQFPNISQGQISLQLLASPSTFFTPADVVYTFSYTNNSGETANNVQIDATFSKWQKTRADTVDPTRVWQTCEDNTCNPTTLSGPTVTRETDLPPGSSRPTGIRYTIGTLAPGQSGSFTVKMRTPFNVYPVATQEPRRPAGSGRLYVNGDYSTAISEASAASMSMGPVFVITKARVATTNKIFPLEVGEFLIKVENQNRDDSVAATQLRIVDPIPPGAEYVPGDGDLSPITETVNGKPSLVWNLPGPLNKGAILEIRVRFRKLDTDPCKVLNNGGSTLTVSSAELPLKPGSQTDRYTIGSRTSVRYDIQAPVVILAPTASPSAPPFGSESTITIKVRNYWPQPIVGGRLTYTVQPNATYIVNSATGSGTDQLISQPDGQGPGGDVVWNLNMDAGSITTPTEKSFSITVRAGYSKTGKGVAAVTLPAGIPSGCVLSVLGGANPVERLVIRKYTEAEAIDGRFYARQGEEFPYVISLTNNGIDPIETAAVVDTLPDEVGANFAYVQGSSTIDDVEFPPSEVVDGLGGRVVWQGIRVDPGQTRYIRYRLEVNGSEFQPYCNQLNNAESADRTGEAVRTTGVVCVRISPDISISKTLVDGSQAEITGPPPAGGYDVRFRLRIQNNDSEPWTMSLYDFLPDVFSFVAQESGNAPTPTVTDGGDVTWPMERMQPGASREVVILTKFNPPCATKEYKNELGYNFRTSQNEDILVVTRPPTIASIKYLCGTNRIDYQIDADRPLASLGDRMLYTLKVSNKNTLDPIANATAIAVLPQGFTFVEMGSGGSGISGPTIDSTSRPDGRVRLSWNISQIAANSTVEIRFYVRTSNVINQAYEVWANATAPNLQEASCKARCKNVEEGGETISYATAVTDVRPLHTYTPKIISTGAGDECANAGDFRTYQVTLINTNSHAYNGTVVTATLPLGLHYTRPIGETPPPEVRPQNDGSIQLIWRDVVVPAKPPSAYAAEVKLEAVLKIGQVWGDQPTAVVADSPDGLIPRTDGEIDPTVKICQPDSPSLAKDSSLLELQDAQIKPGQIFFYQIEVVNPTSEDLTLTVEDVLPANVSYQGMAAGPGPQVTGSTLRWTDLTVGAADSEGVPGVLRLLIRVRLESGSAGTSFSNTATVVTSSQPVNTDLGTIGVDVINPLFFLYMPVLNN